VRWYSLALKIGILAELDFVKSALAFSTNQNLPKNRDFFK